MLTNTIKLFTIGALCLTFACKNVSSEKQVPPTPTTETTAATKTEPAKTVPTPESIFPEKGDYCFLMVDAKDTTEIRFRVLSNDDIRGEMTWRPFQKDGAVGTLTGKMNAANEIEFMYDYTIEGSRQSETKVMKVEANALMAKRGPLVDRKMNGKMVYKNVKTAVYKDTFVRIKCD